LGGPGALAMFCAISVEALKPVTICEMVDSLTMLLPFPIFSHKHVPILMIESAITLSQHVHKTTLMPISTPISVLSNDFTITIIERPFHRIPILEGELSLLPLSFTVNSFEKRPIFMIISALSMFQIVFVFSGKDDLPAFIHQFCFTIAFSCVPFPFKNFAGIFESVGSWTIFLSIFILADKSLIILENSGALSHLRILIILRSRDNIGLRIVEFASTRTLVIFKFTFENLLIG